MFVVFSLSPCGAELEIVLVEINDSEFLLKLEQDSEPESSEAIRNLVLLVASLTFCGHTELNTTISTQSSLYQLPDFEMPVPENRGSTVRNIHAFQVLQSVFLKCSSASLGGTILEPDSECS